MIHNRGIHTLKYRKQNLLVVALSKRTLTWLRLQKIVLCQYNYKYVFTVTVTVTPLCYKLSTTSI